MARDGYTGRGGGSRRGANRRSDRYGDGRPEARGGRSRAQGAGRTGGRGGYRASGSAYGSGRYGGGSGSGSGGSGRTPGRGRGTAPRVDLLHSDMDHENVPRRTVVAGLLGAGVLAAVGQLLDYQVVNAQTYRDRADERRVSSQTLFAKRGTIYDRNGNVIAQSVECENVYANPKLVEDVDKAAKALVTVLGMDEADAREKLTRDKTFVYLKRQVNEDLATELAGYKLKGIEFEPSIMRVYPYGNLASQILGVVNIDNEGISGLEAQYNDILTGTNGYLVRERARDGSFIAGGAYEKVEAEDGADLVLTLDMDIQQAAEEALAEAVEGAHAVSGSVIVTDPRSGEILACCSCPTYDQTDLSNASSSDMNLRVVTDSYEPGSVFKTLVSGMALDLGLVTPDTEFAVPAQIKVGDDMVGDADDRDYGLTMTLREIMRRSSNTGMVMVGEKIGADRFAEYLDTYQITGDSGIDFPGENQGTIRARKDYDGSSLGSMSFGQGIAVAPIRVARAVGSIANGGIMTTPHFVQAKGGERVDWSGDEVRTIGAEAAEQVTSMMVTVVDEGTGEDAQIDGYDVAGKTGTAQRATEEGGYAADIYMSSFLGFAPASDPEALCYVTLDGTPRGSNAACEPFVPIMSKALSVLGVARTR